MVDVYRPPAPLGPRVPLWIKILLLWVATILIFVFVQVATTAGPDHGPNPSLTPWFTLLLLSIGLVATIVMGYAQMRMIRTGSAASQLLAARGMPVGDPDNEARLSDAEERRALRLLRRGAIPRREYEKIIARRHFAHGEITRSQYEEIVRELDEKAVDLRRGARAPPGSGENADEAALSQVAKSEH